MTKVTVFRNSEDLVYGFQISGHSGYAEEGSDIVCSAVSVLAYNTVNSIEVFTGDPAENLAVNEEDGYFYYRLKRVSKESELLLNSFVLGIQSIEGSYGEFITIEFEEG